MKARITILDSNYSVDEDNCNFIAYMAPKLVKKPPLQPIKLESLSKMMRWPWWAPRYVQWAPYGAYQF